MPKCKCGCGKTVGNLFAQGHDQKLRSKLIDKACGGGAGAAAAKKELKAHGWPVPKCD